MSKNAKNECLECPKCKSMPLEIHGEGILSDGRHYPLECCTNYGFEPTDFE